MGSAPTASPTGAPTASPTGSPTSAPTASPTGAPTASPTNSPTDSTTDAPTTCFQDPDKLFNKNKSKKNRNCGWLARRGEECVTKCQLPKHHNACPASCGKCCADDASYTFETKQKKRKNRTERNCAWIAEGI